MQQIKLGLDYAKLDYFVRELGKLGGRLLDKQFGEHVTVIAELPASEVEGLRKRFS